MKRDDGRVAAITALIVAIVLVVFVASASVLVIAGLWKLNARTPHAFSSARPESPGPVRTPRSADRFVWTPSSHRER